jgi:hypothetical protein
VITRGAWPLLPATVPIEYLVIAFPDGNISEEIAPELADLVDQKVIRILDIVFVTKDTSGGVNVLGFDELENLAGFAGIDGEVGGLIGPDDLDFVASELDPGCAAAVLLMEDLWAAPLASALDRSGGMLLEGARIPRTCSPPRSPNWPRHPDLATTGQNPKRHWHHVRERNPNHASTSYRPRGSEDGHHR